MRNFKVSVRAGVSFMLITCMVIALGGISLWKMRDLRANLVDLQDNSIVSIVQAYKISGETLNVRLDIRRLIAQKDPQATAVTIERLKTSTHDVVVN